MPFLQRLRNALLLSIAAVPLAAADAQQSGATAARERSARVVSSRDPWIITYDHVAETMTVQDHRGREQSAFRGTPLADGPLVRIPPDRPLEVRIRNANPMLYTYTVTGTVVQERKARGCRAMLGTFAQAGLQFRALSLGQVPMRWSPDSIISGLMSAEALARRGGVAVRGTPLSAEDRARTIALVTSRVQQYEDSARSLAGFTAAFEDSLAIVAELADATDAGPLLEGLAQSIRQRLPGAQRSTDVALALRDLARDAQQPATVLVQLAAYGDGDIRHIRVRFDSALTSIARSYRSMQAQLYRVERYQAAVDQRWTLEPSGDYRAVRIRMESTSEFEGIPRFRSGTVEALTNPSGRVTCNMAPGLALANTPLAFGLRNDTIVQTSNPEQRAAASLLLHFDMPDFPLPLGAIAGIGLGAHKRPDWYLGGSVRLSDVVRINAGSIWQREERLGAGWSMGGVVPAAQRTAFEDRPKGYTASFFWGVSLVP